MLASIEHLSLARAGGERRHDREPGVVGTLDQIPDHRASDVLLEQPLCQADGDAPVVWVEDEML